MKESARTNHQYSLRHCGRGGAARPSPIVSRAIPISNRFDWSGDIHIAKCELLCSCFCVCVRQATEMKARNVPDEGERFTHDSYGRVRLNA